MSTFETALKFWWGPPKLWGPEALASFTVKVNSPMYVT